MERSIVIKLGGSLLYDLNLNVRRDFMAKVQSWYLNNAKNYAFVIFVVGGGKISRHLVNQVETLVKNDMSKHRIGMEATRTNAAILAAVLGEGGSEVVIPATFGELLEKVVSHKSGCIVTGGFKAGWSSDMNAVVLADLLGLNKVYKLTNVDHIYTADPTDVPDASPIKDMDWKQYFKMFNISMEIANDAPNLHVPIGTHAAQFAVRKGISFFVSGGSNLEQMQDLNLVFESGTYVHP